MQSINPANGEKIRDYDEHSWPDVETRLEAARSRFESWRRTSFSERATLMKKAAAILRERASEFGALMTREMGKPIGAGRKEAEKCAWVCDYYADNAERFLSREEVDTDAKSSFVSFQPLGPVLAVMPWNFPFWQVFRFAAPALMAGNVGLLKHASNVPGCALAIETVFRDAGFPEGCFTTLMIGSKLVDQVIAHKDVVAVTLTGSTPAGQAVASSAGQALKKTVLELGGSDPYVILDDAEIEQAAITCAASRMINNGQSCIAAKRFIATDKVHDAFLARVVEELQDYTPADPMSEETRLGPMARTDLRDELHDQVKRSIAAGAKLELGGEVPNRPGAWYPATVLSNVQAGTPAYVEEMFGPVASVIRAKDETDAIRIANDSEFGLGAAVFTKDVERGARIAETQLEAGACFVNAFVKSDPRLPFGGIKTSGYGRELAAFGIREFVNIKTVYVA
ncbi:MAG: NAD-dependent succinate-semialdehyde dehydrogenase [Planctomycetes bacterium]|nr:NAD-dependent succinate-semialdehyde dehydrogenase [Planctomycetota bacterium]